MFRNLGTVAETKYDWAAAEHLHREALRLRREVADARGVLRSLHALGRARLGAGDRDEAERCFTEAGQLAESLGETLERAKIWHTRAELLLRDGDSNRAQELAADALKAFTQSRTRYDMTHARVTLSRAALASGNERLAIRQGALARSSVQIMGYGLLCVMYPGEVFDLGQRTDGALTAYACGDALGVPWETAPNGNTDTTASQIEQLPARQGWPRGATSDDTALTLLAARHLAGRDGDGDPDEVLAGLAGQAPAIRGLGPTTTAAIGHFHRGGEPAAPARATNGAAMRALPIGWVLPHDQAERRRQVTITMSRATHADPAALIAACVIAACASWALEGASPPLLGTVAAEEAREAAQVIGTEPRLAEMLTQVSAGTWDSPASGISLDPYQTVAAVLWSAARATSLRGALVSAVQLGGDTDTVAALAGGLMGGKLTAEQVRAELPWCQLVILPQPESAIAEIAAALATARAIQSA
ncbi:MAG TPA: ADP-ribosylglycohydrolase family protein [Trebonia sp.]